VFVDRTSDDCPSRPRSVAKARTHNRPNILRSDAERMVLPATVASCQSTRILLPRAARPIDPMGFELTSVDG